MIFDSLGLGEMGVVLALALVLIEPKKLGKVMKEFTKLKKKVSEIQSNVKTQIDAITLEADAIEKSERTKNDKKSMRQWGKDQAQALTAENRAEAAGTLLDKVIDLPTYKNAKVVACFSSTLNEIDTEPLLQKILADGKTLALPYLLKDKSAELIDKPNSPNDKASTKTMAFASVVNLEKDLVEGAFDILAPRPELQIPLDLTLLDLILVPGTCFDLNGGRLGQGKGFYDKYLPNTRGTKVGLCFDVQITQKNLALEPQDQKMDALLSEKRVLFFSAPRLNADDKIFGENS